MTNKTQIAEMNELVQRYIVYCYCGSVDVVQRDDGHLVMHSDYVLMKRRAEAAEARIAELGDSFDELASIVGFSKERCEQTGDSPVNCAKKLVERIAKAERAAASLNAYAEKIEAELAATRGAAVPIGYINRFLWQKFKQAVCNSDDDSLLAYGESPKYFPVFTHPAPPVVDLAIKFKVWTEEEAELRADLSDDYWTGFLDRQWSILNALNAAGINVKSADGEG